MAMHDGASDAIDDEAWLTADRIAELSRGRVKANTVRSWWRTGALEFEVFPELGSKSNKRSRRDVVDRFLRRKLGDDAADGAPGPAAAHAAEPSRQPRIVDLIDTLTSVKAAADSALQALLSEAEHHAQMAAAQAAVSRAQAEADTIRAEADLKRVETLRHLQNMFRGYDLALTTHLQPDTPEGVSPRTQ
ncbi:hypothetical protein HZU40_00635 (plasmid) [Mycolicibacterium fluoranthenivorans]|uniref:Uncharacterized protein n=1 Tax=Mycolicibacterium fluoranthenivorans TaxID=258505 RepID=A0A7G8P6N0_9MYCO|nr:hypothetical protein [Mycolicibacterium fluoranthenivorans]QNJ89996.1 hypothetical protein HZU40_00635 [Mycolicibacterium fluoranthenivorans]